MLLIQANGGLGAVFLLVKQSEELAVILPVPACVSYVRESFILNLARDLAERRERFGRWWTFRAKLFFLRQPKGANPSENLQPRQEEPAHRCGQTQRPISANKINRKESSNENSERSLSAHTNSENYANRR